MRSKGSAGQTPEGASRDPEGGRTTSEKPSRPAAAGFMLARSVLAASAIGAAALHGPLWLVLAVAIAALGYAGLTPLVLRAGAARAGADLGAVVGITALVSRTAAAMGPFSVVICLPVVGITAYLGDLSLAMWLAILGTASGAVTAAVSGYADGALGALLVAPLGGWLIWAARRAGTEAQRSVAAAAALDRRRSELVTTVSHELRTPLTVIQGAVATLSRRWDVLSEPERLDLIDVLIDNAASLDASILHFVDASRLERGAFEISPDWVDVSATLDAVQAQLTSPLAGHELRRELGVEQIWVDRVALARILEHLLVNAVRFSPVGLAISVRLTLSGGEAVLAVSDRGHGLAPELAGRAWQPLERGDVRDTGVSRGAGLGLAIVRELARLHGGDADLTSVRGRGTTVTVRLPQPSGFGSGALAQLPCTRRGWRRLFGHRPFKGRPAEPRAKGPPWQPRAKGRPAEPRARSRLH